MNKEKKKQNNRKYYYGHQAELLEKRKLERLLKLDRLFLGRKFIYDKIKYKITSITKQGDQLIISGIKNNE